MLQFIILIFMDKQGDNSNKIKEIDFPQINSRRLVRVLVGIRPFRKGGIRLEKSNLLDKIVVHNYGHGGAGISLAPATAEEAADLMQASFKNSTPIGVLGSGINGLMTALECAKRGFQVTIYASRIPKIGERNTVEMCTSEIAPGYWLPYHYQIGDKNQHISRCKRAYMKYLDWSSSCRCIKKQNVYQNLSMKQFKQRTPEFISNNCEEVQLKIGCKIIRFIKFQTFQIHVQHFLSELINACEIKGIRFETKDFDSIFDVCELPEEGLVNCLGLGAKKVFGDDQVYGKKGHLLQIVNTTSVTGIFGIRNEEGNNLKFYCFKDKIIVGLTSSDDESMTVDDEAVYALQKRAYQFYKDCGLGIKPKL